MSGYIHVLKDLLTDPRFTRLARTLLERIGSSGSPKELGETVALGCLVKLWLRADSHIRDDDTLDLGPHEIDEIIGIQGVAQLLEPNWAQILDAQQVRLPNYLSHNGISARRTAQAAARQAKHRAKISREQALHSHDDTVTRESDSVKVENVTGGRDLPSPPSPNSSSPSPSIEAAPRRARSRTVPKDFVITEEMRAWGKERYPTVDLDRETEAFRDHEFKDPHSNWPAAWRQWIRRAAEFRVNGSGRPVSAQVELKWRPGPDDDEDHDAPE